MYNKTLPLITDHKSFWKMYCFVKPAVTQLVAWKIYDQVCWFEPHCPQVNMNGWTSDGKEVKDVQSRVRDWLAH